MKKFLFAIVTLGLLAYASANTFTVYGAFGDINLVPTATAGVFGGMEASIDVADTVGLLFGVAADVNTVNAYTGFAVDLARREGTDATAFLAARVGVGVPFTFTDPYLLGTATVGVRGDNGLVLEGGMLYRTDFSFSGGTFVPVVLLGYGFQF